MLLELVHRSGEKGPGLFPGPSKWLYLDMNRACSISIALLAGLLASCATLDEPSRDNGRTALQAENISALNGYYRRASLPDTLKTNHHCPNNLFHSLFLMPGRYLWHDTLSEDLVKMEVLDAKRIKVTLLSNGQIEKEKILKGRLSENTFEFNRRSFLVPLLLMNYYEDRKTRIALLQNGNLCLDTYTQALGSFFIFPWAGGAYSAQDLEFEKVEFQASNMGQGGH